MTALLATPTTGTITGWLILAMWGLALVCVVAGLLAATDELQRHLHDRRRHAQEIDALRRDVFGTHDIVIIDGQPISVTTDEPLNDDDVEALTVLYRAAQAKYFTDLDTGAGS